MSRSYPIVFYVSGHGFGHTSRSVEVIHELLRRDPTATVVVKTTAPRQLFERTLHGRIEVIGLQCDAGMVQIDSLNVDVAESVQRAKEFQTRLPGLIFDESSFLGERAAGVVVGDIPPLAFGAAAMAAVPSIAIGNFTWDWIYENYAAEEPLTLAEDIRRTYRHATKALRLPMAGGFAGLETITQNIPFIARHSKRDADDVRRALGLPDRAHDKPLVLISFGGYGVAHLNTAALAPLRDYTFATTDLPSRSFNIEPAPGILYISEGQLYGSGLGYQDLVRAADVVVTKPGYGIIAEAIANDTAILYTSRGHFIEYAVLVEAMPRYVRSQFIEKEDLLAGKWGLALERLLSQPDPPEKPALNGAELAAAEILRHT